MEQSYEAFDLQRMFIGDFSVLLLLEIAVRTAIMYLYALGLVRFIGKRGIGQLTPFEYVIVIALGSATGDPMFYPEVPLVHGMVVLAIIVALQKLLIATSERNERVERFVSSTPSLLIEGGVLDGEALRREGLAKDELMMELRMAGVRNIGQVEYAWLEPSGAISVFAADHVIRPGQPTFPHED